MTAFDYAVRLFILTTFAMTAFAAFARAVVSEDERAVAGNLVIMTLTAIGTYAQIPMRSTPVGTLDWLRVAGCVMCLVYLATLARKGLR